VRAVSVFVFALGFAPVVASCYRPVAPSGAPCAAGEICPAGLACRGGLCLAPGDDPLDAVGDGAGTDLAWRGVSSVGVDGTTLSELSTSELSADAGDLLLAVVSVKPSHPVTQIAGLGATWTRIREQCGGRDTARLAMFWAMAAATSGKVTVTLNDGAAFLGSVVISVHRYGGADPVAPIGAASWANTNGHDGDPACTGGVDTTSYAWSTLDTSAPGSLVFVGAHTARYSHTPGAGFVEREDFQAAPTSATAGVAIEATPTHRTGA